MAAALATTRRRLRCTHCVRVLPGSLGPSCGVSRKHRHPPQVIVLDMDTGEACEASESLWDGVAASLALSPDQAMMFGLLHRWWKSTTQVSL